MPQANLRFLSSLMAGGLSGFTFWHYQSAYPLAAVREPEFFADAAGMVCQGDFLAVSAVDGGAILYVRSAHEGRVDTVTMISTEPLWSGP